MKEENVVHTNSRCSTIHHVESLSGLLSLWSASFAFIYRCSPSCSPPSSPPRSTRGSPLPCSSRSPTKNSFKTCRGFLRIHENSGFFFFLNQLNRFDIAFGIDSLFLNFFPTPSLGWNGSWNSIEFFSTRPWIGNDYRNK